MGPVSDAPNAAYPPLLLQHHRSPMGRVPIACPTHTAVGDNPLCGDRLRLCLRLHERRLVEIECDADGCAISRASASMLAELLTGRGLEEALELAKVLLALLEARPRAAQSTPCPFLEEPSIQALLSVRRYPARTRCATLCWETLVHALSDSNQK